MELKSAGKEDAIAYNNRIMRKVSVVIENLASFRLRLRFNAIEDEIFDTFVNELNYYYIAERVCMATINKERKPMCKNYKYTCNGKFDETKCQCEYISEFLVSDKPYPEENFYVRAKANKERFKKNLAKYG